MVGKYYDQIKINQNQRYSQAPGVIVEEEDQEDVAKDRVGHVCLH